MDYARLARFLLDNYSLDHIPGPVVLRSKEMMLNAAAVALAAAGQPEGGIITRFVQDMGGNGACTIIGRGLRTSPTYASLANGMMVRLLDFDDELIVPGSHPSSTVFPVVMALGEMNGSAGTDVLAAFTLGCEVGSKLTAGPDGDGSGETPDRGTVEWWSGSAGAIGAAAAAGLLLGLEEEPLTRALAIAGEATAVGSGGASMATEALQSGYTAMSGLVAARLARDGLDAPGDDALPHGKRLSLPAGDQRPFFEALGNPFDVEDPGVALKLYPCPSAAHTAIDAVLQTVQLHRPDPHQVDSIEVRVPPGVLDLLPVVAPRSGREARRCLGYIVAATLLHGQPLIDFFSDAAARDPEVREMMRRVAVEADESATQRFPYPSTVVITLRGDRRLEQRVEFARGQPQFPLDPEELDAKFLYCSRYILPPDHIEEAIDGFRNLEKVRNITGMASVLGG